MKEEELMTFFLLLFGVTKLMKRFKEDKFMSLFIINIKEKERKNLICFRNARLL